MRNISGGVIHLNLVGTKLLLEVSFMSSPGLGPGASQTGQQADICWLLLYQGDSSLHRPTGGSGGPGPGGGGGGGPRGRVLWLSHSLPPIAQCVKVER